jgi:hypothetical protein
MTVPSSAPSGAPLHEMLSSGIAGLELLTTERLAPPRIGEEDDVVPIEELLYRGEAALARATELGDLLRQGRIVPNTEILAELHDLLQLAAAE